MRLSKAPITNTLGLAGDRAPSMMSKGCSVDLPIASREFLIAKPAYGVTRLTGGDTVRRSRPSRQVHLTHSLVVRSHSRFRSAKAQSATSAFAKPSRAREVLATGRGMSRAEGYAVRFAQRRPAIGSSEGRLTGSPRSDHGAGGRPPPKRTLRSSLKSHQLTQCRTTRKSRSRGQHDTSEATNSAYATNSDNVTSKPIAIRSSTVAVGFLMPRSIPEM